jgi:hypothetical protein
MGKSCNIIIDRLLKSNPLTSELSPLISSWRQERPLRLNHPETTINDIIKSQPGNVRSKSIAVGAREPTISNPTDKLNKPTPTHRKFPNTKLL